MNDEGWISISSEAIMVHTISGRVSCSFHGSLLASFRNTDFTTATQEYACMINRAVFSSSISVTILNIGWPTDLSGIYFWRLISEHISGHESSRSKIKNYENFKKPFKATHGQ